MARIELRDAVIRIKDGLSGTAALNDGAPGLNPTTATIDAVVLNTADTDLVPVGARFTWAGESGSPVHTVTARTPTAASPTTDITFTPAYAGTPSNDDVLTFLPQQVDVKIGDGNLTWTVNKEYEYLLDRGNLDTVREGDQQPLDVTVDSVYEHITTGTNETISPYDAMNGVGGASEWVSASTDLCEPYAVDLEVVHTLSCGTAQDETTNLPDFRYDTLEVDIDAATISFTGRCNAVAPTVTRS